MPFERLLVVPTCVFGLVSDQLIGGSYSEAIGTRHIDVVEDEGHFHVCVDVDQIAPHFDLHCSKRVVQFGTGIPIWHFEVIRLLGVSQDFHTLTHCECFSISSWTYD